MHIKAQAACDTAAVIVTLCFIVGALLSIGIFLGPKAALIAATLGLVVMSIIVYSFRQSSLKKFCSRDRESTK